MSPDTVRCSTIVHGPCGAGARSMRSRLPHHSFSLVTETNVSPNHCTLIGLATLRDATGTAEAADADHPDPFQYSGVATKFPRGTRARYVCGMQPASN